MADANLQAASAAAAFVNSTAVISSAATAFVNSHAVANRAVLNCYDLQAQRQCASLRQPLFALQQWSMERHSRECYVMRISPFR
jgi:hypothetical protein